jgi:exonuclease SbcC
MEQGIEYNVQELLESWLAAGIFTEADIELLTRIKPIFIS